MSKIITSTAQLRAFVKVNSAMPFESLEPYINDAESIYLLPYVGQEVLTAAETDATLKEKVCRCLGPLSMALATDELGIMFGDGGITVQNEQGKRSPAKDAKIQAAKENLMLRGMQALDRLTDWLRLHCDGFPGFVRIDQSAGSGCFIRNADDFQNNGYVNIERSTVAYRQLLPVLLQLQQTDIRPLLTDELYSLLLANEGLNGKQVSLRHYIVLYLASKSAALLTSQNSRRQRQGVRNEPEFKPLIRPLYTDQDDSVNFFMRQADFYLSQVSALISSEAEALGLPVQESGLMDFNGKERKLFTSIP